MKVTSMTLSDLWQLMDLPPLPNNGTLISRSPIDGETLAHLPVHTPGQVDNDIQAAVESFYQWRLVPAPRRGELVRRLAQRLRTHKPALGDLIVLECGKIRSEALGEVQEMIDICDFAVGLSRQIGGLTLPSERPGHRLQENWHPLGPCAVITAFNFPMAVWAWNLAIGLVCGNSIIWKPSEKTPLCAIACSRLLQRCLDEFDGAPEGLHQLVVGEREIGEQLTRDPRIPLVSATGSCRMGAAVAATVASRFGRSLLELGGNNAAILTPSADWSIAIPAIVFGAAGTAGQRCTTTRRLFVPRADYDRAIASIKDAFAQLPVGDPGAESTLVGPLIDQEAFEHQQNALNEARSQGLSVYGGERLLAAEFPEGWYVRPALVAAGDRLHNHEEEVFAPILYVFPYDQLEEAIQRQNAVSQGLSSALFSNDLRETELFLSAAGSDCGLANINTGTSGAEIGGAFGGEKATGGGRESGSDAWKQYMRRSTVTLNYSRDLPLAQGVEFRLS